MGAKTPKTSDRRIQRTHRALNEALVALVTERGWDGFTVQDLCDRADVGRSTFYMHFADKEDVLKGGFEEFRRGVQQATAAQRSPAQPFAFARAMIDHTWEQRHAFRALLGRGSSQAVLVRFREMVIDLVQDDLAGVRGSRRRRSAAVAFLSGGFLGLLTWGLEDGSTSGADELKQLFDEMAAPVLDLLQR